MGRKGPDRGKRPGNGRRPSQPEHRREPRSRASAATGPQGSSRLLLTRLLRGDAIWNVYVATSTQGTQLEFEDTSEPFVRHARPVRGSLLDALYAGTPVSRSTLQDELELALARTNGAEPDEIDDEPDGTDTPDDDGSVSRSG